MSFFKSTVLIITFNFLRFCELTEYDRFAVVQKRGEEVKACGSMLADLLAKTCAGIYNEKRADYRLDNVIPDLDYYYNNEANSDAISGAYPFRSKRRVFSILRSSPLKRKHGLVDECCKKWCTISELTSYCG